MHDRMNLSQYRKCFNATEDQFIALHEIDSSCVDRNVRYEKITDVTCVKFGNNQFFFFKDDRLKMIYVSDEVLTKKIWNEFRSLPNTSTPDDTVRSRAGKTSNQKIFASQGFAASIANGEVDFVEIYPPCSLQEYLDNIYRDPGKFIR